MKPAAFGNDLLDGLRVKRGVQQLVELAGGHAQDRGFFVDQPFPDHVDGDLDGGRRGAFAVAGLQHVELAFFNGELDVLHILVMFFQDVADLRPAAGSIPA